jgi:hypothetical protein
MWSIVEREVSKQPYNILAFLGATISKIMADIDREVVIQPLKKRSSGLGLRLL